MTRPPQPRRAVTKGDIEQKLRDLAGGVEESIASRRQKIIAGGVAVDRAAV